MPSDPTTRAGAVLLTLGIAGLVWLDLANDTLRADVVPSTIGWFLVAALGFALLLRLQARSRSDQRWKWLLVLGLVLRLLLVVGEPTLSDDVYRYLWEGHLVTEGVSPYSFAIDSPLADPYDIAARSLANNTSLASPYLPVAHGIFGATAAVLPSEAWTMQVLMIAFDVLAAAMIIKLLGAAGLPQRRVLLYWLNPLVIVEVAHGAHIDAIIVGLGGLGLWLSLDAARRSTLALFAGPVIIAAATLTRPLALLFIPVLFWIWDWRQRLAWFATMTLPIAAAGTAAGLGLSEEMGTGVFGSARAYTDTFRFNSGIYHWLERWISSQGLDDKGWNEPAALTRLIITIVVIAALLAVFAVARAPRDIRSTLRLLAVPVIVYVVLTPVLHPWYILLLLSLVPFLAPGNDEVQHRWLDTAPWLVLSGLVIFSYLTYEDPAAFAERDWVRRLEWYPTLALALASLVLRTWRARRAEPSTTQRAPA